MLNRIIRFFLAHKLVTVLLMIVLIGWGLITAPFGWKTLFLPSDPVPVDAIPDIGENQQIIFTPWMGRSPQDIEDQITYPLTTSLLGIPGVKSIRSSSVFGFSSIYIIFNEDVEFYWSRSRILEKLNSLPVDLLPDGVRPSLGPDATALGQVYWYTIEGRDRDGNPTGGWDLHEIRSVQDFFVKYGLNAVEGVSEVASIGGFVQEYQIDVNPDALNAYDISLQQVMDAVRKSNRDVGAKTIEINQAEYLVRGLGYIKSIADIEETVVDVSAHHVPITIKDIALVTLGPATRRGLLDKEGAEVVGGVVVARHGSNPLAVINKVKDKIKDLSGGLPKKTLANGVESQLTIVPFYDRTQLINETLGTLEEALSLEILITILVVIVMVLNLRASILIAGLLPIAVLMVFIAMRYLGVDANIVALSGIAIAIGTMVDLGIVLSENVIKHMGEAPKSQRLIDTIYKASAEVSSAIVTAVSTTVVSFIPVFAMEAAEGKLFRPLAFTKTFALLSALAVSLLILPSIAHWVFGFSIHKKLKGKFIHGLLLVVGLLIAVFNSVWAGVTLMAFGLAWFFNLAIKKEYWISTNLKVIIVVISATWLMAKSWMPLGANASVALNFVFVVWIVALILGAFLMLEKYYLKVLYWCLDNKKKFLSIPVFLILFGVTTWLGFATVFGFVSNGFDLAGVQIRTTKIWSSMEKTFPGIGKEFMPALDEGSFLLMPTSMPHAGMTQNKRVVQQLDMLLANIPEVELAVGKMGRVESALDPAPISMYENIINYKSEYMVNKKGHRVKFKVDEDGNYKTQSGNYLSALDALDADLTFDELVPDDNGNYYRNWRPEIKSPDDIWNEIVKVTKIPGVTSAPKLQPIETRLIMLQTGMRAPMGVKVYGPDLATIESFGRELEVILKEVPSVKSEAVFADRIVGKPYIHLNIDRQKIARYGLSIEDIQQTIEAAVGGRQITSTVEGRERFPVRVRYPRELRDDPATLAKIYVRTSTGTQVPLGDLIHISYAQGPQMIKSEDTFLVGYVLFDKKDGYAEVDVVEESQRSIQNRIDEGTLVVPAGISFKFSGSYENQIRAEKRLAIIVPLVLIIIFLILYFQFKSISTSLMIFMGVAMAFSGAFMMLWFYGQDWFLDFSLFSTNMRELFQIQTVNLSVAVWVGFIALFGIATDDGVLIGTYLDQSMKKYQPATAEELREAVTRAGLRRIKPAVMTSATTIIALLPVLTSTGRGADVMIPMAIPAFGGMIVAAITFFVTPVLYYWREEYKLKKSTR
ncbi:efflux RND transporter permease subunit [Reichenbachiella carrageenanivorans]|uniref:Efflux RND transporter permease subunit n=1 Tax=Reichenbachiella carrageenanivorans TaxID=2979869 RepID=A0ABY6CZR1_9BACT|nr:efflux RND transporter permease subunit [Reichenbachiella carrageenanivorans]UXX78313.1 efflux RND transporter permease subunit [Reichenbachiella carrageenanivorans]